MAYAATAGSSLPSMTAAPGVLALQRALLWPIGACGAIVFIEPSPYELATLTATMRVLRHRACGCGWCSCRCCCCCS